MDGIHSTAPDVYGKKGQLFVIRAPLGNTCVSVAYAYLPSHKASDYEEMLRAIKRECVRQSMVLAPKQIMCDFEKSIHKAVRRAFGPNVKILGCFYHLTQATWRQVQ